MIMAIKKFRAIHQNEDLYLKELNRYKPLSAEEERALIKTIKRKRHNLNYFQAREMLILHNLRLVFSIAKKYMRLGLPAVDLVDEGILGLIKALERFNPEANCRFGTYASWWIKQAIHYAISNHIKNIRIPSYLIESVIAWKNASNDLANELSRMPTQDEISERLSLDDNKTQIVKYALNALDYTGNYIDIDSFQNSRFFVEENENYLPQQHLMNMNLNERLWKMLSIISKREATILRWRYGLDDGKEQTLSEIAARLKLSRERVRQIEAAAIKKLRGMAEHEKMPITPLSPTS